MRDCVCLPDKVHLYCDTKTSLNIAHSELSPEYLDAFWLGHSLRTSIPTVPHPTNLWRTTAAMHHDDDPIRGHFCRPRRSRRLSLARRSSPCMRTAPPHRRRPSEGMDEDVEAVGMGDNQRRSRITLERLLGMLM